MSFINVLVCLYLAMVINKWESFNISLQEKQILSLFSLLLLFSLWCSSASLLKKPVSPELCEQVWLSEKINMGWWLIQKRMLLFKVHMLSYSCNTDHAESRWPGTSMWIFLCEIVCIVFCVYTIYVCVCPHPAHTDPLKGLNWVY